VHIAMIHTPHILNLVRVRATAMAGNTFYIADNHIRTVFFAFKIFFIDAGSHLIHFAGHVFFRLFIAGEIHLTVGTAGVAEVTMYAQSMRPIFLGRTFRFLKPLSWSSWMGFMAVMAENATTAIRLVMMSVFLLIGIY